MVNPISGAGDGARSSISLSGIRGMYSARHRLTDEEATHEANVRTDW